MLTKREIALAKTGIIALIDEATGYQYARPKNALKVIHRKHIKQGGGGK
jgi:hypothetical protein